MYFLLVNNEVIFYGTRREIKRYVRKNKIKNYKIVAFKPQPRDLGPIPTVPLAPYDEPINTHEEIETFNTIFDDDDD